MLELAHLDPSVLLTWNGLIALLTLTALELVLGIDNIIFISIISNSLPVEKDRARSRRLGLLIAMVTRVALLLSLNWVMSLDQPFMTIAGHAFSGRDLVLIAGGLFLLYKATVEIHEKVQGGEEQEHAKGKARSLAGVILQIVVIDLVFSLDSVITAVGMSNDIIVMVLAVIIAVLVMMLAANSISAFVEKHATVKVLALSFLVMIGVALLIEGMGEHINKNYIYFAMGFSVAVEMLNLRMARNRLVKR
ncbi:MAG: TerC family protein [Flavobacteriales bacterium]|nr:TerC family protein [Flavobacteriales bacterium]